MWGKWTYCTSVAACSPKCCCSYPTGGWKAAAPIVSTIGSYSSFRTSSNNFCWYHIQIISQVLVECHKTIQNGVVSSPFLVHFSEFYWQKINHILKNQSYPFPSPIRLLDTAQHTHGTVVAPVSGMARQSGFRGERWATWAPVTSPEDSGEIPGRLLHGKPTMKIGHI